MNSPLVEDATKAWGALAELLERLGQGGPARLVRYLVDDLARREQAWSEELLTIDQAAAESGRSYSHIQHLVADGSLPNAGRKGHPRIRRRDLPGHERRECEADPPPTSTQPAGETFDVIDRLLLDVERRG